MGGHEKEDDSDRDYLMTRLMYISEQTSTAIRLNASWALTHPAMSLTRDRYEQLVRFSWLTRKRDDEQINKYFAYYHARANKIFRALKQGAGDQLFAQMVDNPPELTMRDLTDEEKHHLGSWGSLDLLSMAKKRDALQPFGTTPLAGTKLELFYPPIYGQFSSVSHSDMYSVALLELHRNASGMLVLSADPHWPSTLAAFNSLFDLIQCFECAAGVYGKSCESNFHDLYIKWHGVAGKTFDS
jgi:hypothetical protein